MASLQGNRTLEILRKAEEGGYGINAQTCYDANAALALVQAAEEARSPAILQIFPITLEHGKGPFLKYCLDLAHSASVPISVHLDHATSEAHLELALGLAEKEGIKFDSIMVDASHADTDEENITISKPFIERCHALGIATEVELGRLEGGEAGLREITGGMLTNPDNAENFMNGTGALILAPSIGNLHGAYLKPPNFRQDILQALSSRFKGRVPLCLHGTDTLPDSLFQECIKNGVSKINLNSWGRDPYAAALAKGLQTKSFPEAVDDATAAMKEVCIRMFNLFGSAGKA